MKGGGRTEEGREEWKRERREEEGREGREEEGGGGRGPGERREGEVHIVHIAAYLDAGQGLATVRPAGRKAFEEM